MNSSEILLFNEFSKGLENKGSYSFVLGELQESSGKDLVDIIPSDIEDFINSRDNNQNTKRRKYSQLLSFYNYLLENSYIDSNPVRHVSPPKASKQVNIDRTLQFDQAAKLLQTLKNHFPIRDYLITLIIATTGLKLGEVRHLMWSSFFIDNNNNIGALVGPKSNKRYVKIFDFVWKVIDQYREEYLQVGKEYMNEDYYIFIPNNKLDIYKSYPKSVQPLSGDWITKTYKKACSMADIPIVTSKDIRHSYTMLSVKLGSDLSDISNQLGWSNTSFINRYNGVIELLDNPINKLMEDYYSDLLVEDM